MSAGCAMPCGWEATADQDKSPRGCPLIGLIAASGVWRGCGPPAPVLDPPPPALLMGSPEPCSGFGLR